MEHRRIAARIASASLHHLPRLASVASLMEAASLAPSSAFLLAALVMAEKPSTVIEETPSGAATTTGKAP